MNNWTELNWKNKSGCSKGVSENAKILVMLKITLLSIIVRATTVVTQCFKGFNARNIISNSCYYVIHVSTSPTPLKLFDILSFSLRTIRLFSAGLLSAIIWWRRLRTMKYGLKVTTDGGDPTGLFSNITVHNLFVWMHYYSTRYTFFSRWTRYPVWNWRCPRRARDPHLASIVLVVLRQKPSKNDPRQKLSCVLLEMD